ncbi:MAG: phosphoribosylformylglycinamidine synthase subunit PurL [Candidatus Omnitrophota bacterium]
MWRIEVKEKPGIFDAVGESVHKNILDLGFQHVEEVALVLVYTLEGDISEKDVYRIGSELLSDRVSQNFSFVQGSAPHFDHSSRNEHIVEIAYNPGVMDPVEESVLKGIRDMGIGGVTAVRTARQYQIKGKISEEEAQVIVDKVLSNKLIQHLVQENIGDKSVKIRNSDKDVSVVVVDLLNADDSQLIKISEKGQLFLNIKEMRAIQEHFRSLKRNPTDVELETVAQTWSEHCHHKTFRGKICYKVTENGRTEVREIHNLFKSTIAKATYDINKPWCVSVFHDNAGIIEFDDEHDVCFKVETHNHPSALEPFGGANTGIGGVLRDTMGTGLGAKPICNTDVFCFAPPDYDTAKLPAGTLHPKRVMKGVVSGVRDYGNKMGIPTVNGSIIFDDRFVGNPLVYCGNVGLIPRGKSEKKVHRGDLIVAAGGRTGRDGIHGATFSSGELTSESEVVSSGAVQIGDPIQEKKVLDVQLKARDENLYHAVTDCGAGGFSSAVGEMGAETGAVVHLDKAPLKYQGLSYMEIWISESQERMVFAVPRANIERFLELFAMENVEATVIGEFTGTGRLELFYCQTKVCDLDMNFMHDGIPDIIKEACWEPKNEAVEPVISKEKNLTADLCNILSHYNVCSKEWVVRQYDHEVQGGSVIKPFVGVQHDGPSDAAVVAPKMGSTKGIAVSNGINVRYGMIDPYWMAAGCIDEAVRQIVSVGGNPDRVAILDNFCWGNPDKPDRLGPLVRCAQGCYDAAVAYGTPFISGKDSLYNEYAEGGQSLAIPGTILISAIGIMGDVREALTMDFKKAGNLIYIVGMTRDEMGGSIYYHRHGITGGRVPRVDFDSGRKIFKALFQASQQKLAVSIHDCSEGGLGVCLAEMAFSGLLGAEIDLKEVPFDGEKADEKILFSESHSRFLVEVSPESKHGFEKKLKGAVFMCIGQVTQSPEVMVHGIDGTVCVKENINKLKQVWKAPLGW